MTRDSWYKNLSDEQKNKIRKKSSRRKQRIRKWFIEYKSNLKCDDCQENHPACLQFHHRKDTEKKFVISMAVSNAMSIETILEEIVKCRVLCANCHLKLHARRRESSSEK